MKKYLFGILAISMAIGFSAFTGKPAKKSTDDLLLFEYTYTGSQQYSQANVQDKSHWGFVRIFDAADCSADIKPCQIKVSSADVDNYPTAPVLKNDISASSSQTESTPIAAGAVLEAFNLEAQ